MRLSAINISNFRNFGSLELSDLPGAIVVLGENNAGKSNLLRALQLVMDSSMPDRARQLDHDDFWTGCPAPMRGDEITVIVEITDYTSDLRVKAALADCSVVPDPLTARLTYRFYPVLAPDGAVLEYTWQVFGGTDKTNEFTGSRRREVALSVLPALRNAEEDLRSWRGSPLYDLTRLLDIPASTLQDVASAIESANGHLLDDEIIEQLATDLSSQINGMVGRNFAVDVGLGVAPTEPHQVLRALRVLVEGGYPVQRTGSGAANVLYVALLLQRLKAQRKAHRLADAVLAIEEPEAHLHPHVQRVLFRYLIGTTPLVVTTHSAHIASVSRLASIVMLRETADGTVGRRAVSEEMSDEEIADLERYLDVNRADVLFARGVILVEGTAEQYLVPAAATASGIDLDAWGISVCSVASTDFKPYRLLLAELGVPNVVITDGDPDDEGGYKGSRRGAKLLHDDNDQARADALATDSKWSEMDDLLREHGIFVNNSTLELEYAGTAPKALQAAHDELVASTTRRTRMAKALADFAGNPDVAKSLINRIEDIGKGRFAQRAAAHLTRPHDHPDDIVEAVKWLTSQLDS